MPVIEDGQSVEVQGSGVTRYILENTGGVYSCTCPAWLYQSIPVASRTCKHLRAYLGTTSENTRISARIESAANTAPVSNVTVKLLLAHRWESGIDIDGWWMSEKLDGVRAYWDGTHLVSRQNNIFLSPDWFTEDFPKEPLDGELWCGRKKFQQTVSIVRRQDRNQQWEDVTYVVFDAPEAEGTFEARQEFLKSSFAAYNPAYAKLLNYRRCENEDVLHTELLRVEALEGEGVMLRQPLSPYHAGRSSSLLKVKSFFDAEALVLEHLPGAGKHKGRLGALKVRLKNGTGFSVGTGFSDEERENPPPAGTVITFRYQELTNAGVPRFPSYIRVRTDLTWEQVQWPPADSVVSKRTASQAVQEAPLFADLSDVEPLDLDDDDDEVFRQLQFEGSKTTRFWEVIQNGRELRISYGRIGRKSKTDVKIYRTVRLATEKANKMADSKLEKGYEEF